MTISSIGVGSGLDVNGIVTQLMALESQPAKVLNTREASYQAQISAYGSVKGALSALQSAAHALTDSSKYSTVKASSSDPGVLTAAASATASPGSSYSVEVTQLARAQKLAATGQASQISVIGTGTLSFEFGTIATGSGSFDSNTGRYTGASFTANGSAAKTVTIDASHNSLTGIRDAINAANIGVTASIINVGGATPYRLTLASTATGEASSMRISVTGDAALGTLLAHDPAATQNLSETSTAQDAKLKIDGLAISRSTNTITGAIPDVTLTLGKTNAGSPLTVSTARDQSALATSVDALVKTYNDLNRTISELTLYDQATGNRGILLGDSAVRAIQSRLRAALSATLPGGSGMNNLSQAGVSFQKDGSLALDMGKLQSAIASNPEGISALFSATAKSSDSQIKVTATTPRTKPGSYAVDITTLPTQGKTVGSAAVSAPLTITAGVNDQLAITLDSVSSTITLPPGTYTAAALAETVQTAINGTSAFASGRVSVTQTSGVITIASEKYGAASRLNVTGGSAKTDILGAAPTSTDGADVVGSINGVAATGTGQTLSGKSGTATDGLKVQVLGGVIGSRGNITVAHGFAYQIDALADSLLDDTGPISARTNGIGRSIKDIGVQRDQLARRLTQKEQYYRAQFSALDSTIASMKQTSAFLTQQLANLPTSNSK